MKTLQDLKRDISANPSIAAQINSNTIDALLLDLKKADYKITKEELLHEFKMCAESGESAVNKWILISDIIVAS